MKKILFIDDHEGIAEMLAGYISRYGYETFYTTSPQEGVQMAVDRQADLVISDILMPKMDGYEVAKRMSEAKIAVIFLTAVPQNKWASKINGVVDYIEKPATPEYLVTIIRSHIGE